MVLLVSLLAVLAFALALWKLKVVELARSMPQQVSAGTAAMFDKSLDDEAKEKAVQQAGLKLIGIGGRVFVVFALAILAAAIPIVGADFAGLADMDAVFSMMLRLDFIVGVTVAATVVALIVSRLTKGAGKAPGGAAKPGQTVEVAAYGAGDQMIHSLAFASPGVQRGLARLDDRLNAARLAKVDTAPPVFITSLARGGTTAVLNALHDLPDFATHHYRDMPFVGAPLLWSRLSGNRRSVEKRQRAHGDGMEIDLDSAEAFDEVFWMLHWPEKYTGRRIVPWSERDEKPEATAFLRRQFAKIALLRRPDTAGGGSVSYLSKNNANIARLRILPKMFPGARVVIPLRGPAAHAASLHRQHMNFLTQHAKDAFGMAYMRDIGHFEFGKLHKPIGFDGFDAGGLTPEDPDYWLIYWIAAFRDVARVGGDALFLTQDALRSAPDASMHALLDKLGRSADTDFSGFFRPTPDPQPRELYRADLLAEAEGLYADLAQRCVGAGVAPARVQAT
ncbi:MAG: sulfotransferase [Marinibacterium sp.]